MEFKTSLEACDILKKKYPKIGPIKLALLENQIEQVLETLGIEDDTVFLAFCHEFPKYDSVLTAIRKSKERRAA